MPNKKGTDKRPARTKYWSSGKLKKNKISRMVKNMRVKDGDKSRPITKIEAENIWSASRKRHPGGGG